MGVGMGWWWRGCSGRGSLRSKVASVGYGSGVWVGQGGGEGVAWVVAAVGIGGVRVWVAWWVWGSGEVSRGPVRKGGESRRR